MFQHTQRISYSPTPNELKELFVNFLKEKYDYEPELIVYFDTQIWLPIVVEIEEKNENDFFEFWNKLQHDILRLKSKHNDEDFELGDKLLRLILQKDTELYLFDKECSEYIYEDMDVVHIFVNPSNWVSLEEEETYQERLSDFKHNMSYFVFNEEDFLPFQTEKSKLMKTTISTYEECISLLFSYENNQQFSFDIHIAQDEDFSVTLRSFAFCPTVEMEQEVRNISKQLEACCKQKLHMYAPPLKIDEKIILGIDLPIVYHNGLTVMDNIILSLVETHLLSYKEIQSLLQIPKEIRLVDNAWQRAKRRINIIREAEELRKFNN